jgi:hypothetical protein
VAAGAATAASDGDDDRRAIAIPGAGRSPAIIATASTANTPAADTLGHQAPALPIIPPP